jgi:alginate O-acetyltransferase complex protein AlgI
VERCQERWGRLGKPRAEDVGVGMERILLGIFKKAVLAGNLVHLYPGHDFWDFPLQYSRLEMVQGIVVFSFVIYLDFSGYADMAVGTARLFGLRLVENFNYPYLRGNPAEFWRSWHISLSDWIRDYLFMPLCGHRTTRQRLALATVSSMAICGLWHGAAWNFLVWGMYHGAGLVAWKEYGQVKRRYKALRDVARTRWYRGACVLGTFGFVSLGWVFFKVPLGTAGEMFERFFVWWR